MRNLKRALSLALASVMLMGMMVVGSSAASFPDVDSNDNIEAIDVLETVEVMIGNKNGDFEPDKNVTRAEMAVVMAKLLNLDYKYYETTCPFNDVPDWAKGWVGACAANGIVSGRGEGVYDPNNTVTAVEAASMMMRALGYFQNSGDYSPNFESATVRQASAISLFSGIGGNANTPLTRNQVAKLALNTLEANMVYFTGDMGFEMPGVGNVGYRSEYTARTGSEAKYRAISSLGTTVGGDNSQSYVQLGEQLYDGDLKKTGATDGFKAPATRWTYKNTEIGTYTNDENYMLEGEVKSSAMYSTVGKAVAEDYTWSIYMDGEAKDVFTKADVKANNGDTLKGTGRGTVTYVYLDSNRRTATVTVVNTWAVEVTKVKDGKITLNDTAKQLEVEAAGYEEDDIVLYTKYKDGSSWKVGQVIGDAELVEGEADTVRNDKYVVIGDTTYNYSTQFNTNGEPMVGVESVGKDVALYLDTQGNIIYVGEANESTDYALVLDVGVATNKYGESSEYGAQLLLTDGSTLNVDLDKDYTDGVLARKADGDGVDKVRSELKGKAVAYTKESNGTYTLDESKGTMTTVAKDTDGAVKNGRSSIDLGEGQDPRYAYTNENTIFVIHERGEKNTEVNVYTGYKNVPDVKTLKSEGTEGQDGYKAASVISVYKDSKNVVKAVFITDAEISGTKDIIFVVGDKDVKLEGKGDNRYYTFKAVVDGEATTIDIKDTAVTADAGCTRVKGLEKNAVAVFAGMSVNGDGLVTRLKEISGDISSASYIGVQALNGGVYGFKWNGTNKVYDVKIAPTDKTVIAYLDDGTLTVENNLETDNNDKAIVVTNKGELSAIFVTKVDEEDNVVVEVPSSIVKEDESGFTIYTSNKTLTADKINGDKNLPFEAEANGENLTISVKDGETPEEKDVIDTIKSILASYKDQYPTIKYGDATYKWDVAAKDYVKETPARTVETLSAALAAKYTEAAGSAEEGPAEVELALTLIDKDNKETAATLTIEGIPATEDNEGDGTEGGDNEGGGNEGGGNEGGGDEGGGNEGGGNEGGGNEGGGNEGGDTEGGDTEGGGTGGSGDESGGNENGGAGDAGTEGA